MKQSKLINFLVKKPYLLNDLKRHFVDYQWSCTYTDSLPQVFDVIFGLDSEIVGFILRDDGSVQQETHFHKSFGSAYIKHGEETEFDELNRVIRKTWFSVDIKVAEHVTEYMDCSMVHCSKKALTFDELQVYNKLTTLSR